MSRLVDITKASCLPDDETHWEMLVKRARARTVVPFLGAGLSCPLLPTWARLLNQVADSMSIRTSEFDNLDNEIKTEVIREKLDELEKTSEEPQPKERKTAESANFCSDSLTNEFIKQFRVSMGEMLPETEVEWFSGVALGQSKYAPNSHPPESWTDFLRESTSGHRAVTTGPWPIILTTNWDTMLEEGYAMIGDDCKSYDDVWDKTHPTLKFFRRQFSKQSSKQSSRLKVRFRANTQQVYAELKAGVRPPCLLKLHGDFTEKGQSELVAGYADYRRLINSDVAFSRLMHYIFSNFNLLFYGCSLSDKDVLATLDAMTESLGSEIGPHFWLTTKDVSDDKKRFLIKTYSIYPIRAAAEDLEAARKAQRSLLIRICNEGWPLPKGAMLDSLRYQVQNNLSVRIEHGTLKQFAQEAEKSKTLFALALGIRLGDKTGGGYCVEETRVVQDVTSSSILNPSELKSFAFVTNQEDLSIENKAQFLSDKCCLVCTQDFLVCTQDSLACTQDSSESEGPFAKKSSVLRNVFVAVQQFLQKSLTRASAHEEENKIQLILPLLGSGNTGKLHVQKVLCTMLSAVGEFSSKNQSKLQAEVIICLGGEKGKECADASAIMADIDAGRFQPGQLLAHARQGKMEFTCIAPVVKYGKGKPEVSSNKWQCRKLFMDIYATVNGLRKEMKLKEAESYKTNLLEDDITDGSVKTLKP